VTRVLVAIAVLAPLLVAGTAFLLLAEAVADSWLWAGVLLAGFLAVCAVALGLCIRWAERRPRRADDFSDALTRAVAFGLGGLKPSPKSDDPKPR
jgi:Flp pilus assembly protein TadB